MSDYPPRVDRLRAMLMTELNDGDFSIEEIWRTTSTFDGPSDKIELRRFWRITIQADRDALPHVVDVPDKLVIESLKATVALFMKSPNRIIKPTTGKAKR